MLALSVSHGDGGARNYYVLNKTKYFLKHQRVGFVFFQLLLF